MKITREALPVKLKEQERFKRFESRKQFERVSAIKNKGLAKPMTSGLEFKQQELQSNRDFKVETLESNLSEALDSFDFETKKPILIVYVRKSHIYASENKVIDLKILNQPMFVHVVNKYYAFTGVLELSKELSALKKFNIASSEYPCMLFLAYDANDQLNLLDFFSLKGSNVDKLAPSIEKRLRQMLLNHMNTVPKESKSEFEEKKERVLPQIPPQIGNILKGSEIDKAKILSRLDSKPQTVKEPSDLLKNKPKIFHDEKKPFPVKKTSFDPIPRPLPKTSSMAKDPEGLKAHPANDVRPQQPTEKLIKNDDDFFNFNDFINNPKREQAPSNLIVPDMSRVTRVTPKPAVSAEEQRRLDQERR